MAVSASDVDGGTLAYTAANLPQGLSINAATGVISGTIGYDAAQQNNGNYSVSVTATDPTNLSDTKTFAWAVANTNRPPVLNAIPNQSNFEGAVVSLTVSATDPDGDAVTYSAENLPNGLTIHATTGVISGTIQFDTAPIGGASGVVCIIATDPDGAFDFKLVNWQVKNVARPPVLNAIPDQNNAEGESIGLALTATDPDDDVLSFAASGLPMGLQIDPANGTIYGTIAAWAANTNNGVYQVSVTVYDPSGLTDTKTFIWTVANPNREMTTFTVNITADTPDANVGDGIAADANGKVSLRAAVEEANALDALTLVHGMRQFTINFDTVAMGADTITILNNSIDVYANTRILGTSVAGVPGVWLTSTQAGLSFKQWSVSSVESVGFKNFDDTNAAMAFSPIWNLACISH